MALITDSVFCPNVPFSPLLLRAEEELGMPSAKASCICAISPVPANLLFSSESPSLIGKTNLTTSASFSAISSLKDFIVSRY